MTIYYQKGLQGANMHPISTKTDDFNTLLLAKPVEIESKDKTETVSIGGQPVSRAKGKKAIYFISGYLENGRRNNKNLISRNLLVADIDEGIHSVESLHERLNERLIAYSFYLYPSTSFTEESLKFRLVVDSERAMDDHEYMATLKEIEQLLEMKFDDKSYTWAQMMGLPITDNIEQFNEVKLINRADPYRVKEVSASEKNNRDKIVMNYKHLKRTDGSYTGSLLEKIVNGSDKGERNNWLTSITGSLFNTGMDSKKILILLHVINQNFISPPLKRNEVDSVFKSILRKEMANY